MTSPNMLCHGDLVVVETEDDLLLGTAEVSDDVLVLRSGFVGRPLLIPLQDVEGVTPASSHPDIE